MPEAGVISMPREYGRNKRVADLLQRELAVMIQREQEETGAGLVTVSHADVSPDLSSAKLYITSMGSCVEKSEVVDLLNERTGYFRHLLSKRLAIRSVPRLQFKYDYSIERGTRLAALIDSLAAGKDENKPGGE